MQAEKQVMHINMWEKLHAVKQQIQQIPGEEKMALKTEEVHATNIYFINTLKKGNVNLEGLSVKAKLTALPMCES